MLNCFSGTASRKRSASDDTMGTLTITSKGVAVAFRTFRGKKLALLSSGVAMKGIEAPEYPFRVQPGDAALGIYGKA